ncbi:electron transfer flavoprotein FixB [Campylobacter sp. RM5004]|uniref:electron transfer flavoprotein subunit alpha/FixB family protein n=1 Tax=Campylobacter sp. RM5004 TaxID=1660078 RepID=UPI001EFC2C17|nr:electron transfer flavoprotein subunit alpha/FixB family protein [Campylobacter sp. RM5004]ULO00695.1 electron transfer flavoprotein FixB [Campylobacter sp. RM5004]
MKIYVFTNEIDTLKKISNLGNIDTHYCTESIQSIAENQIKFNIANGASINDCAKSIAEDLKNQDVLFITSSANKDLAALVAGYLDAPIVSDVSTIDLSNGVKTTNIVYGGAAIRTSELTGNEKIISLSANYAANENEIALKDVNATTKEISANKVKVLSVNKKVNNDVDLSKAKIIVAVGRGFAQKEDLDLAYKLAEKLGAQIACSRPIAETEKWIDKSRYIGISANIIAPDLYIAIGISGQVQHLVGCVNSKKIVVINKDDKAPFFESADLGIVGDLKEVLKNL